MLHLKLNCDPLNFFTDRSWLRLRGRSYDWTPKEDNRDTDWQPKSPDQAKQLCLDCNMSRVTPILVRWSNCHLCFFQWSESLWTLHPVWYQLDMSLSGCTHDKSAVSPTQTACPSYWEVSWPSIWKVRVNFWFAMPPVIGKPSLQLKPSFAAQVTPLGWYTCIQRAIFEGRQLFSWLNKRADSCAQVCCTHMYLKQR